MLGSQSRFVEYSGLPGCCTWRLVNTYWRFEGSWAGTACRRRWKLYDHSKRVL